jgi:hypothetical protein
MGVRDSAGVKLLIDTEDVAYFHVTGSMSDIGFKGELADNLSWNAVNLCIPYEWHFPDGKQLSFSINDPLQRSREKICSKAKKY